MKTMIGRRISSLKGLSWAVRHRRSVITKVYSHPCGWVWSRPMPAAFVIGIPGKTILGYMRRSMFLYIPKEDR